MAAGDGENGVAGRCPPLCAGVALFIVAAVVTTLGYAWYTNHVWEDYLITFRHSQNLCEGHGLVYRPGERVHGFTSPLGTLLPALCHVATGRQSYVVALWLFRVLSTLAFVGAGLILLQILRESDTGRFGLYILGTLYVVEVKAVAFSMNGMETAFMLLFVAWGLRLVLRDPARHWFSLGLCGAGLLWTRPDGCVYFAILALASLLFAEGSRKTLLFALVKSGLVCAVLYLPWFIWAWSYYGSPIPNTVRAKGNYHLGHSSTLRLLGLAFQQLPGHRRGHLSTHLCLRRALGSGSACRETARRFSARRTGCSPFVIGPGAWRRSSSSVCVVISRWRRPSLRGTCRRSPFAAW